MRFVGMLKRANTRGQAEESVALRVAVLIAVVAATTATLAQGVGTAPLRIAATLGVVGAFAYSHHARHRDGYALKAFLAVGVVLAFGHFLAATAGISAGGLNQVQVPLAELFLWVQVLHSLDVPARRDLLFSLLSSLVLMAVAGVLSVSSTLAPYLIVWAIAALVALVLAHRSELADRPRLIPILAGSTNMKPPSRLASSSPIIGVVAIAMAVATAAFLVMPAAGAGRAIAFPASLPRSLPVPTQGGLANPSLGGGDPASPDGTSSSTGSGAARFGYFGFANQLDTSTRGRPDNTLVMRVRASRPDFWRGQTFDTWNGRSWTQKDQRVAAVGGDTPIRLRAADEDVALPWHNEPDFVQTVYVERPGPNLIFAARVPDRLYFGDRNVFQMSDGTIRTAVHLEQGAVYTVVSKRPAITEDMLRHAGDNSVFADDQSLIDRYTELPSAMPARIRDLAASVTANEFTRYDKVRAIESWMAANTTYTLDVPSLPPGEDAVDRYLFVDKRGFCEQIATSMVVMLRSLGVPARLAVGYAAGKRNPFTGMWEVRASDAHAWAEVWFPGVGWQAFDPTAHVPLTGDPFSSSAATGLLAYVRDAMPRLPSIPLVQLAAILVMGAAVVGGIGMTRRARGRRRRAWADVTLERLERAGARYGRSRRNWETPASYADTLARSVLPDPRVRMVADMVERDAFAPEGTSAGDRDAVAQVLSEIEAALSSAR